MWLYVSNYLCTIVFFRNFQKVVLYTIIVKALLHCYPCCLHCRLRFLLVDIGQPGSDNDGVVLHQCSFGNMIENVELPIHDPKLLVGTSDELPHVFIGFGDFALKNSIMKPYTGMCLPNDQLIFNYYLSRTRMTIKSAFGISSSKCGIYKTPSIFAISQQYN